MHVPSTFTVRTDVTHAAAEYASSDAPIVQLLGEQAHVVPQERPSTTEAAMTVRVLSF
jgi:hypothetical protein